MFAPVQTAGITAPLILNRTTQADLLNRTKAAIRQASASPGEVPAALSGIGAHVAATHIKALSHV